MAKEFGQRPSDFAFLDDSVGDIGRWYFDSGVWAFGNYVGQRLNEVVSGATNPIIARSLQDREFERLMGVDTDESTTGFAEPPTPDTVSVHGRIVGDFPEDTPDDDEEDIVLEDDEWLR